MGLVRSLRSVVCWCYWTISLLVRLVEERQEAKKEARSQVQKTN